MEKYNELDKKEKNFIIGLDKIKEATIAIQSMEVGLKEEENQLKEKQDQTDKILANLEIESRKASQKQEEVETNTKNCKL
jgi:hypothetical protein